LVHFLAGVQYIDLLRENSDPCQVEIVPKIHTLFVEGPVVYVKTFPKEKLACAYGQ
jgi:hypothetical protein